MAQVRPVGKVDRVTDRVLTAQDIAAWKRRIGGGSDLRTAQRYLRSLDADGVHLVPVPSGARGGKPARGVMLSALAEHLGVDARAILGSSEAEQQPRA